MPGVQRGCVDALCMLQTFGDGAHMYSLAVFGLWMSGRELELGS